MRASGKTALLVTMIAALAGWVTACTAVSRTDFGNMSFSTEPLLGKVIWHDLITEDVDAAREFYGGLFGWTFEDSTGPGGEDYARARSDGIYVAGLVPIESPADGGRYSRWLPYISVADVDDAVSKSVSAGATVAAAARNVNVGRVAAVVDPEGAVIGLAQSDIGDPDDATTAKGPGKPVWNELLANDPQAAAFFYGGVAGYDVRPISRRGGQYTMLASAGADRAGIFENPSQGNYPPVWLTAFGVDDPAAAADRAVALGGTIILPVSPELRDGTTAVVTDPSGAVLVLQQWSI
jgi:predicted enzyme related to lactoylglutathione lyase